ncbi:MAG: nucleotidyltransferase domain-containing protein [Candidatus Aenigmarchaeota archaeon]|nr:nucleotidyltransferase domain-containing protein [Candidatus Aenigmarchaeota archaeon]
MLKKSNIENVLDFFFRNPTIKLSIRDISRRTGLSVPTVASIVKKLITKDLLLNEKIGPSLMIYANLESEEFRDLKKLYNLYSLIDLKKFLVRQYNHPKVIFVYGSYAKGEDLENSDIDIAIISKLKKEIDTKKFETVLERKIHIMYFDSWKSVHKNLRLNILNGIKIYGVVDDGF